MSYAASRGEYVIFDQRTRAIISNLRPPAPRASSQLPVPYELYDKEDLSIARACQMRFCIPSGFENTALTPEASASRSAALL
jgi:hypothetical protein